MSSHTSTVTVATDPAVQQETEVWDALARKSLEGVQVLRVGFPLQCNIGKHVVLQTQWVEPAVAEYILKRNAHNRPARQGRVNKYAATMADKMWTGNNTLQFGVDGSLKDGQHRLMACVQAGVGFPAILIFGVTDEEVMNIDEGKTRSLADRARIAKEDDAITSRKVSIVKSALGGHSQAFKGSDYDVVQWYYSHKDSVNWVEALFPRTTSLPGIGRAQHAAVALRALLSGRATQDKIERAAHILYSGEYDSREPGEVSILKYREWAISQSDRGHFTKQQGGVSRPIYHRFESMLLAYLEGRDMMKVSRGTSFELFDLTY